MQFCVGKYGVRFAVLAFLLSFWQSASNLKLGRDEQQDVNNKGE
jgi:hypothetical protein